MHGNKKNLVYVTLHGRDDYAQLFDLFFASLLFNTKSTDDFTLLVDTSSRFIDRVEYVRHFGLDVDLWVTADRQSVFDAAFARYSIFEFPDLSRYDKVLYLDVDILLNGNLNTLFQQDLSEEAVYCLQEGPLSSPTEYYGRSLFIESNRHDLLGQPGVTSGAMLFRNSKRVESLFRKVLADGYADRQRGRTFLCLDQPYLNYNATVAGLVHCGLMEQVMENNPARFADGKLVCHFPGGPGNYESKIQKIAAYFLGMVRHSVPPTAWEKATEVLCTPSSSATSVPRLDHLAVEGGGDRPGLVIHRDGTSDVLFVAIPSFSVSHATRLRPSGGAGPAPQSGPGKLGASDSALDAMTSTIITRYPEALPRFVEAHRQRLSQLLSRHYGNTVAHGPLKGFRLADETSWGGGDRGAMLLGLYEREVLDILAAMVPRRRVLINVGAADGYYGVGLVASGLFASSYCFEMTVDGRRALQASALKNNVTGRVSVRGKAEKTFYESVPRHDLDDSVLLVDVEGAEFDLIDTRTFHAFARAPVIIELHEWIPDSAAKIDGLIAAAATTHSVQKIVTGARDLSGFPELKCLDDTNRWLLCSEGRPCVMTWLRFDPRLPPKS
ncbi:MAG: glycosyltransferase [Planctomycetia bacterium]